jgi:hypothetical protein
VTKRGITVNPVVKGPDQPEPRCGICGTRKGPLAVIRSMLPGWQTTVFLATGILLQEGGMLCRPCAERHGMEVDWEGRWAKG